MSVRLSDSITEWLCSIFCDRGLDFAPPISDRVLPDETPIIVVLPGLSGRQYLPVHRLVVGTDSVVDSQESYVRAIVAPAVTPTHDGGLGYRVVVVNSRGCTPSV